MVILSIGHYELDRAENVQKTEIIFTQCFRRTVIEKSSVEIGIVQNRCFFKE